MLILQPKEPMKFSVIAITKVQAYRISKHDMVMRLPGTLVKQLIRNSQSRAEWAKEHMLKIHKTVT